ncbi:insulin-like growth factor-binding protein complex acid labile subunit [Vespa velutina]|uniref:insulin-like growth factor-binding protein complex acid labile subunit n=1 Tax=Vespa velutina TaxID=202808 RepID=UPI001FB4D6EB|nr:insulin-like growth factor-binding protein complex acid labile subunit [Vespa velutina]
MWLPFILLALMASGSACPDLCVCQQGVIVDRDSPLFADVTCRGRVPELSEVPDNTRRLSVEEAEEHEVTSFLTELEASTDLESNTTSPTTNESRSATIETTLPYLDELTMTNCSLTSLNVSWHGFERLRLLNLSYNEVTHLSDARVSSLIGLTCLDLSNNFLKDVNVGVFRTLSELARLHLRRNEIAMVHEDAFRGLDRLEFLDLSDNRLADLPDSALTPLYSLQKLDLSGNQLQVLGARWFESLDKLRELDVSRNGLAKAASGTLQPLPGLSVLRLAENPLEEKDVSLLLGTGRRLETVDASRTGLARVPAALTRSVRALRLAGNKLTTIRGGDLDSYPLLRMLDISDNRLTEIEDDALGRLEVLEELDVSGNLLTKTPGSLPSSLTVLNLRRNGITILKVNDFQELRNLRSLMLNNNDIGQIEVGSFSQLFALKELDLSDNPIKALTVNALSGPSNLAKLRMSGLTSLQEKSQQQGDMAFPVQTPERLIVLDVQRSPVLARQLLTDDAALSACKSLLELNLSQTNLTALRSDLPYLLPQLRVLRLIGNDWSCTEDLYWLGQWLREHKEQTHNLELSQCATPEELLGTYLRDLPSPPVTLSTIISTVKSIPSITSLEIDRSLNETLGSFTSSSNDIINELTNFTESTLETNEEFTNYSSLGKTTTGEVSNSMNEMDGISVENSTIRTTNVPRVYEAPTSFRNITSPTLKGTDLRRKEANVQNLRRKVKGKLMIDMKTDEKGASSPISVNVSAKGKTEKSDKLKKFLMNGSGKELSPSLKTSKFLNEFSRNEEKTTMSDKYLTRENNLTKEKYVLTNGIVSNTIAEELNGRATDSGTRLSEQLSGAHPGMLVLVGAALGAAAALMVVLSRRATVRRRDRYHRHENIEVHTLTASTELW